MEVNPGAAYRRHIVIDNIAKVIYIEVQCSLNGNVKPAEYWDLKNGNWHKYVPAQERDNLAKAIAGGYQVKPMVNNGGKNEQYYIIQIVEVNAKPVFQ